VLVLKFGVVPLVNLHDYDFTRSFFLCEV